jgi:plasmid stabilization system protein ParE
MSNREFEYHPEAIIEAWEAFHWYAERNPTAAESYLDELRIARQLVIDQPKTWGPYLHRTRCLQLNRFPYGLVYIERGDRIVGIAVAHLKRRPGYWRKRLVE